MQSWAVNITHWNRYSRASIIRQSAPWILRAAMGHVDRSMASANAAALLYFNKNYKYFKSTTFLTSRRPKWFVIIGSQSGIRQAYRIWHDTLDMCTFAAAIYLYQLYLGERQTIWPCNPHKIRADNNNLCRLNRFHLHSVHQGTFYVVLHWVGLACMQNTSRLSPEKSSKESHNN